MANISTKYLTPHMAKISKRDDDYLEQSSHLVLIA